MPFFGFHRSGASPQNAASSVAIKPPTTGNRSSWGAGPPTASGGPPRTGKTSYGSYQPPRTAGGGEVRPTTTSSRAAGYSSKTYARPGTSTIASVGASGAAGSAAATACGAAAAGGGAGASATAFDPFHSATMMAPERRADGSAAVSAAASGAGGSPDAYGGERSPEEQVRELERVIFALLHESALEPGGVGALAKAKNAAKRERALIKQRELLDLMEHANLDLTYCVLVNLALQYARCGLLQESINTYLLVVKNKAFSKNGRLRVNIGNLYLRLKKYSHAIKMFRMALDQLPQTNKIIRVKIQKNIGIGYFLWGKYQDSATALESVLESFPEHSSAYNLVLCAYALGEKEKLRAGFLRLVSISLPHGEALESQMYEEGGHSALFQGAADMLCSFAVSKRQAALRMVVDAGRIVASASSTDPAAGFDWVIEQTRGSPCADAASELELAKASLFLSRRDYGRAIETLRAFEKRDNGEAPQDLLANSKISQLTRGSNTGQGAAKSSSKDVAISMGLASDSQGGGGGLMSGDAGVGSDGTQRHVAAYATQSGASATALSAAATNLAFLYYLEGELNEAQRHAMRAIECDRYNARAHCNLGNCLYAINDVDRAREIYQEAMNIDALCTEALFNLGLCLKSKHQLKEALKIFEKVHAMLRNSPEALWQVAEINERMGNTSQALEYYTVLVSLVPTDSKILSKIGDMHSREDDAAQAFHYYSESYRYYPGDIDVIAWLGAHYTSCELFDQAKLYFERATEVEPAEVNWRLLAAGSQRRCGSYQQALESYKLISERWPDHVECLRYIVRLSGDLGCKDIAEWQARLAKAETKAQASKMALGAAKKDPASYGSFTPVVAGDANSASIAPRTKSTAISFTEDASHVKFSAGGAAPARSARESRNEEIDDDVQRLLP